MTMCSTQGTSQHFSASALAAGSQKSNHSQLLLGAIAQKLLSSTLVIAGCSAVLFSNPLHLHFVQPFSKALQICFTVYHPAQAR